MSAGGDKMTGTPDREARLANRSIRSTGVLMIGCDRHFQGGERFRLDWRQEQVVANSKQVVCVTYDQLFADLLFRLDQSIVAANAGP